MPETPAEAPAETGLDPHALEVLIDRLDRAEDYLKRLAEDAKGVVEKARINGKAEGVRLAMGYAEEIMATVHVTSANLCPCRDPGYSHAVNLHRSRR